MAGATQVQTVMPPSGVQGAIPLQAPIVMSSYLITCGATARHAKSFNASGSAVHYKGLLLHCHLYRLSAGTVGAGGSNKV